MQAAARQDSEFPFQPVRRLGIVHRGKADRNHAHALLRLPRANQAQPAQIPQAIQKTLCQRGFVVPQCFNTRLVYIIHRSRPAVNPRQIRRPRFKTVRQIGRQFLGIRHAPSSPGNQRGKLRRELLRDQQSANPLRAKQSLMRRNRQRAEGKRLEIHRDMPRRLRGIQNKGNSILFT